MKKLLAFVLAALMLIPFVLTACGTTEEENENSGAEIQMFLTTLPESIDPSASYTTADHIRIMGLIFEGLTKIDDKGKLENALCKSYEYEFDERTGYLDLFITLGNSRWSDGNLVTAEDFRFAWKRILLPENNNSNAALLYPILNAKKAKEGLCSIDDLGVYALKNNLLQIRLEKEFVNEDVFSKSEVKDQIEYFMRRLASPALVPLREDVVDDNTREWCTPNGTSYVTNGPFKIRAWNSGELTFERSVNYQCIGDDPETAKDTVVKPYKLITAYTDGTNADEHYKKFKKTQSFYVNLNSASKDVIKKVKDDMESDNLLSTYCIYLDTNHALFSNVKVRQALSLALNRNDIAKNTNNIAATGFVPVGVEDTDRKSDFREKAGDLISAKANMKKAKKLLADAGITPSRYVIAIDFSNSRTTDAYIANACKEAWSELGFKIQATSKTQKFINSKEHGDYPLNQTHESIDAATVILVNLQSQTTDAYSILTSFSSEFGGTFVDVTIDDVVYDAHVTGYTDETYDKICSEFVNAKSDSYRAAAMHIAEEYLVEQMPVIPVIFNQSNYITQELSKYESDKFGRLNFTELKQKNYEDYLPKKSDK